MRILGIDLGTTSIKAVAIESAFGRFHLHEYHEQKFGGDVQPSEAIQALLGILSKRPDKTAVALRSSQVTFRNLQLPTRDKKAIQASVGFELEDDLPFPLEDAIFDYTILSQSGQSSNVHVAATLKRYLMTMIQQWQEFGLDPDLITTEAWAYRALANRALSPEQQEEPVLIANIGQNSTTLYVHWNGAPIVSREVPWGGKEISEAISKKYGVSFAQADTAKLDHGFVLTEAQRPQATPEQIEFSDTIMVALHQLFQEMRQAEFTCKSVTRHNLKSIYITGGTSVLPGLARKIEEELYVHTYPLKALSSINGSGVEYSEHSDSTYALAAAVGLALVGPDRASGINLRKGEFAKAGSGSNLNFAALRKPAIALAAIGACLLASLAVQRQVYQGELSTLDTQLEKGIRAFLGPVSASAVRNYTSSPSSLRTKINSELNKQREQARLLGPNPKTPIGFLKEISANIPKDVVVDLMQFNVGASAEGPFNVDEPKQVSLSFNIADRASAERLAQLLNSKIQGIKSSDIQEVTLPEGIRRFQVTFTGAPAEGSYGQ